MRVYMDNGATTRVTEPVYAAMQPYFCEIYGNPSSVHGFGREARKAVEAARAQVAKAIGAQEREIYFTGCGTESDNWAIRGAAYANVKKGRHIITTNIEHHAVLHTCKQLEQEGFEVTYLPVDSDGLVMPEQLAAAIRPDTTLVTIMYVNNEIGTIEPIPELAAVAHEKGVLFHTDAVQAVGHVPIDVAAQGIDLLKRLGLLHEGNLMLQRRHGVVQPGHALGQLLGLGGEQRRGAGAGVVFFLIVSHRPHTAHERQPHLALAGPRVDDLHQRDLPGGGGVRAAAGHHFAVADGHDAHVLADRGRLA